MKACAIKCKDKVHKGGSLYYCQTFRQKSLKDKNELLNKVRICRLCLQPQHIGANGHIDTSLCLLSDMKCKKCNRRHNTLICPESGIQSKANVAVSMPDDYAASDDDADDCNDYASESESSEEESEASSDEFERALICKDTHHDIENDYFADDDSSDEEIVLYDDYPLGTRNYDDQFTDTEIFFSDTDLSDIEKENCPNCHSSNVEWEPYQLASTPKNKSPTLSDDSDKENRPPPGYQQPPKPKRKNIQGPLASTSKSKSPQPKNILPAFDYDSDKENRPPPGYQQPPLASPTPSLRCYESLNSSSSIDWMENESYNLNLLYDDLMLPPINTETRMSELLDAFQSDNESDDATNIEPYNKCLVAKSKIKKRKNKPVPISEANKVLLDKEKATTSKNNSLPTKTPTSDKFEKLSMTKDLSELSKSVNAIYKEGSLIDVSEKGNKVTSYRSPQKHWKKSILEGKTYIDKVFPVANEKSLIARQNCDEVTTANGPYKKFLSSLEKNFYATNTFISPNSKNKNMYKKLAKEAQNSFNNFRKENIWNNKGLFVETNIHLPKENVNLNLIKKFCISFNYQNNFITLKIPTLLDSGSDRSYLHDKIADALDLRHLAYKRNFTTVGVNGKSIGTLRRVVVPIKDAYGRMHLFNVRLSLNDFGMEPKTPALFKDQACKLFGIEEQHASDFNFLKSNKTIHMILGVSSPFCIPQVIDPSTLNLNYPVTSPSLKLAHSFLSKQILICGTIGIAPELFTKNFPVFQVPKANKIHSQLFPSNSSHFPRIRDEVIDDIDYACNATKPPVKKKKDKMTKFQKEETNLKWDKCGWMYMDSDDDEQITDLPPNSLEELSKHDDSQIVSAKMWLLREDHVLIKDFFENENTYFRPNRKCKIHSAPCDECDFVNRFESQEQENLVMDIYHNQTAKQIIPNKKYKIIQKTVWRNDPHVSFHPSNSNLRNAAAAARSLLTRLKKKDPKLVDALKEQILENIKLGFMTELTPNEVSSLNKRTHSFCFWNYVHNEKSSSTPVRLVCNSSTIVPKSSTSISIEQKRPDKPLNNMFSALLRLRLYPIPLISDIKKAYKAIGIDPLSAYCRLLYFFKDPHTCSIPMVLARNTLDFGDAIASFSLEVANIKFVSRRCKNPTAKEIVENVRYADNLTYSFKTKNEFYEVKKDLMQAYSTYDINLKYLISTQQYDKDVLKNEERGPDEYENLFGLKLHLVKDELTPNLNPNIYKKQRGKTKGPGLFEKQIELDQITRTTLSRVTAQLFDLSGCFLAPFVFTSKSYLSMACTIASLKEVNLPLFHKDKDFATDCLHFVNNLSSIKDISPFDRVIVPEGGELVGFVASRDGSEAGYGSLVHALYSMPDSDKLGRSLVAAKSKVCRRGPFVNELLSIRQAMDLLLQVLEPLRFDISKDQLEIINIGDSTACSAFFNPGLRITSSLARGTVEDVKDAILSIGSKFENARTRLCWIPGVGNVSDTVSKIFDSPITIVNSPFYRKGPKQYDALTSIVKYTYLDTIGEELKFSQLPDSILGITNRKADKLDYLEPENDYITQTENFFLSKNNEIRNIERCMASKTFDPSFKPSPRKNSELEVKPLITDMNIGFSKPTSHLMRWCRNLNFSDLYSNKGILHNYKTKSQFLLSKELYLKILQKFLWLDQVVRVFSHLSWMMYIQENGIKAEFKDFKITKEGWANLLRNSQLHFPPSYPKGVEEKNVDNIKVVNFRLKTDAAFVLFGTPLVPLINKNDPLVVKAIRRAHVLRSLSRNSKLSPNYGITDTISRINSGSLAMMIPGIKSIINSYVKGCKICQKQNAKRFNPIMGPRATKIDFQQFPFSILSLDPLGEIWIQPFDKSRTRVKLYPLVFLDINLGYIHVELVEGLTSKDILLALLTLESQYHTKVSTIVTDAGTSLAEDAISKEVTNFNKELEGVITEKNLLVRNNAAGAQWRNPVENSIRLLKRYIRQILDKMKSDKLPALRPMEARFVFQVACQALNARPFSNQDGLLSPSHFVLTSPFFHLLEVGNDKDGALNLTSSYSKLRMYVKLFKKTRKTMVIAESKNYIEKRMFGKSKNVDLKEICKDDLVFVDYPGKSNTYDYGRVEEVVGSDAKIVFRNHNTKTIPIANLYPLSQAKHSMVNNSP